MPDISANAEAPLTEGRIEAVVIRCGCGDPMSHAERQLPCPTPAAIEDRGTIAYYHRNPLRRLAWAARQGWKEGRR